MKKNGIQTATRQTAEEAVSSQTGNTKPWQEPKVAYVEPKLTNHGKLEHVTAGFFGTFTPE